MQSHARAVAGDSSNIRVCAACRSSFKEYALACYNAHSALHASPFFFQEKYLSVWQVSWTCHAGVSRFLWFEGLRRLFRRLQEYSYALLTAHLLHNFTPRPLMTSAHFCIAGASYSSMICVRYNAYRVIHGTRVEANRCTLRSSAQYIARCPSSLCCRLAHRLRRLRNDFNTDLLPTWYLYEAFPLRLLCSPVGRCEQCYEAMQPGSYVARRDTALIDAFPFCQHLIAF